MKIWDVIFDIEPLFNNIDLSLHTTARTEKLLDYIEYSEEHLDDIIRHGIC